MNVFDVLREKLNESANVDIGHHFTVEHNVAIRTADAIEIVNKVEQEYNNGWIPVSERYPENNGYILISFENFSLPDVGRYEEDEEGGAFYPGDDSESYVHHGLIVNAWRPLPAAYREGMVTTNADRIRAMSDEELAKHWPCPYDTAGSNIMPCILDDDVKGSPDEEYCRRCMMNWLQKEVDMQ